MKHANKTNDYNLRVSYYLKFLEETEFSYKTGKYKDNISFECWLRDKKLKELFNEKE